MIDNTNPVPTMIAQPAPILHLVTTSRILQSVLQSALQCAQGFSLNVHSSVEACLATISTPPAAILLDHLLCGRPCNAGLQMLSHHAATQSTPVILLHNPSAKAQASRLQSEFPSVRRIIQKPFAEGELLRGLEDLIPQPVSVVTPTPAAQPVHTDPPTDLTRILNQPAVIGGFQWQADTGNLQVSNEAARRLGNTTPFCVQLCASVAEAAGLGELREVHLFSRDANAALCSSRTARNGGPSALRVTGVLIESHQGIDEVLAQVRASL